MTSKKTKKYRALAIIFDILTYITLVIPLIIAVCYGYNRASNLAALGISGAMLAAIIMVGMSIVFKLDLKSWIWLLIMALGAAIDNFTPFLFVLGVCSITEEIVLRPAAKRYKEKYKINMEIDDRL